MADKQKELIEESTDIKEISPQSKHDNAIDCTEDKTSTDREADDEPQFHSAEEDGNDDIESDSHHNTNIELKPTGHEKEEESPLELIDVDGGGEGIAETVEIEKEFLDKELLDVSEDDDKQEQNLESLMKEVVLPEKEIEKHTEEFNVENISTKDDSQDLQKQASATGAIEHKDNENIKNETNENIKNNANENIENELNENIKNEANKNTENEANENIESKANVNMENKASENIDNKVNENIENKANENIDNKVNENVENKANENIDNKVNENIENKSNQNVEIEVNESIEHGNEILECEVNESLEYEGNESIECEDEEYDEEEEEAEERGEYVEDEECGDEEDEAISDEGADEDEEGCVDGDEGTFVKGERQQGDGEECDPNSDDKALDFDEDRRNPQYIPKKGIFYEHDDRIMEAPKEKEADPARDKKKKKLWSDDGKWGHDRYREDEQIPKSRDELIEVYGYDIRCEDGPPRARRRRRYGRGPTKYEPNWEEEKPQRKERTLGMFIRRGTRGGRVRGRSRGGPYRGTGRPYSKPDNENYINNNTETFRPNDRKSYHSFPPKQQKENFPVRENVSSKPNMDRQKKEVNLCGWEDEFPVINDTTQKKTVNIGGQELENFKVTTPSVQEKKETTDNLCGWESDEETKHVYTKKEENTSGWESDEGIKPVRQKKEENICGWESDENPVENQVHASTNNKEFPSVPKQETSFQSLPIDRNSAFTRKKPTFIPKESQEKSSVRTQTFENSTFSNNKNSFPSYEKPPRHEALRGVTRGSRRTIRGRSMRGSERYSNNNESYIKPTVGPRLLDKQMNRVNTELERLNLHNRHDTHDNVEGLIAYEQKQNINIKGNVNRQNSATSSSKNEDSASRSKRYSHIRQKTVPETSNYPASTAVPPPRGPYYDTSYQPTLYASDAVTPSPQPPSSASPPVISPPQFQQYSTSPYPEGFRVPMPVSNTPRLYPQVTVPAGQPLNMTPSPCITPAAGLINYPAPPPAQPGYPPQYAYQQYPQPAPPPPPPVSQPPPDMFRGGITYYYPQTPAVRQVTLKRPKAAIPIIPPPESEIQARKEASQYDESQCNDIDSEIDGTDSTVQSHAPVKVES